MDSTTALSSSYLQIYSLSHSQNKSFIPKFPVRPLKISSLRIDETYGKSSYHDHQTPPNTIPSITLQEPPKSAQHQEPTTSGTTRREQSLLTTIFNFLDHLICKYLQPPLGRGLDPRNVLSGNFAPVGELPPTPCDVVEGSIPPSLRGAYIRNGPNPQFIPQHDQPHHLFDGDGMLHVICISGADQEPTFCSRYVKTYKYTLERDTGSPVIPNFFSAFNGGVPANLARCVVALCRVITGQYDPTRGVGLANTSVAHIGGKLYALAESDLPYEVKVTAEGDVITVGRQESFGGGDDESFMTMTAHPKIDLETGEAFAFRYSPRSPFLTYFRIDANGTKQREVPITSLKQCSFIHDFALSENYVIFPDVQIVIKPMDVILKGRPLASVDPGKVPRLGVIPRYAVDEREMWWVEVPGLNAMHTFNAWEEDGGDTIVMLATNVLGVEHMLERMDLNRPSLERIEINVTDKSVTRRCLSARNLDLAVINPSYVGKENRYVYAALLEFPMPKITGVVKVDLSLSSTSSSDECVVASRLYGPGCYGGEPFFVPREPGNPTAEEDDGYLLTYVHSEISEESKFLIMDSKSPSLEIVASVKLPQRVPYGFHGTFVPECDLQES